MQAVNQIVALLVVGGDGDVLCACGGAEGAPDGAAELRASIQGDGCWHAKPGYPGCDEGACAVVSCCRGQRYRFHPPGRAFYDSKKICITTCSGQRSNQVPVDMAEVAVGDGNVLRQHAHMPRYL